MFNLMEQQWEKMSKDELFREYERLLKQLRETGKKIEMLKANRDEGKSSSSVLRRLDYIEERLSRLERA